VPVTGEQCLTTEGYGGSKLRLELPGGTVDAITGGVAEIKETEATVHVSINPRGFQAAYDIAYGKTTAYGAMVPLSPKAVEAGSTAKNYPHTLTGLEPGKTYHYRVVAQNQMGPTWGDDVEFTTP
jgi:hypothetical protein